MIKDLTYFHELNCGDKGTPSGPCVIVQPTHLSPAEYKAAVYRDWRKHHIEYGERKKGPTVLLAVREALKRRGA